ncbi:hypothetical protein DDI74_02205 [Chryseobacterium gleum]|nr:hypothetical protein DDI74_02205 [Chryseobacterium gleum]
MEIDFSAEKSQLQETFQSQKNVIMQHHDENLVNLKEENNKLKEDLKLLDFFTAENANLYKELDECKENNRLEPERINSQLKLHEAASFQLQEWNNIDSYIIELAETESVYYILRYRDITQNKILYFDCTKRTFISEEEIIATLNSRTYRFITDPDIIKDAVLTMNNYLDNDQKLNI